MESIFSKLFIICAAAIICELICENTSCGKTVRTVCSLCICVTVFTCFMPEEDIFENFYGSFTHSAQDLEPISTQEIGAEIIEKTKLQLEKNINSYISENFGINPDTVCIQFSTASTGDSICISAESAKITVKDNCNTETQTLIESAISALIGCEVSVN